MSGDEEFYFTEIDINDSEAWKRNAHSASISTSYTHSSSGPESPVSLSEDAASSSSGSMMMANGDNSMDSSPPSSPTNNNGHQFFKSAFRPVHLEDHVYNRRPDPAGISILGNNGQTNRRGRKSNNSSSILSTAPNSVSSHPINIPSNQDSQQSITTSTSFGGFSGASSLSSGFGSYNSFSSSFSPVSPPRSSGSLSSSLTSGSNKFFRINSGRNGSGTTLLQNGSINRTSPTKRGRGETRKCRKVYGMDKKDSWCTQCKWKKACTRFID